MFWANFFHIYQPADQQPDILEAVTQQSYRPIMRGLKNNPRAKITLNVTGALLELFDKHGYRDIIDDLKLLGERGQAEFTGSAKYHAFLPFLDEDEIIRQVQANNESSSFYLGRAWKPKGFFPPEMAYDEKLAHIIENLGFSWIILDEIACRGKVGSVDYTKLHSIEGTSLKVFFRERRVSNLIMSAVVRSVSSLKKAMQGVLHNNSYVITAMDGETFGHHRPGLENLLFEIFNDDIFHLITISEIADRYHESTPVKPTQSTWASSERDLEQGIQFLSWRDPENPIHAWQWELVALALTEVRHLSSRNPQYEYLRKKMDVALASDHFWWASAKPWWSIEMIEDGAYRLLDIVRHIPRITQTKISRARDLYEQIVSTAFQWKRSGKIYQLGKAYGEAVKIPFKERTLEIGGKETGIYYAFMEMMKRLEQEAARKGEYEQAVLWRDAQYKIEHKSDVYDAVNAINLLRTKIPHEEIEKMLDKYTEKYQHIRSGQPEQRG